MLTEKQKEALLSKQNLVVKVVKPQSEYLTRTKKELLTAAKYTLGAVFYGPYSLPMALADIWHNKDYRKSLGGNLAALGMAALSTVVRTAPFALLATTCFYWTTEGFSMGTPLGLVFGGVFTPLLNFVCHDTVDDGIKERRDERRALAAAKKKGYTP